ncbi:MAG: hypothetical protein J6N51_13805 [Selenomonas sp.]|nr:hypothetical protein [Selenomonas sp.]
MATITWNIRHYLKDGTELKPGMQFPDTQENRARLQRVWEICQRHNNKGGENNGKD